MIYKIKNIVNIAWMQITWSTKLNFAVIIIMASDS